MTEITILYIGDIMGEAGMQTVAEVLPKLKKAHHVDAVIAQAENVTDGKGLSKADFRRLRDMGIDFCTGGNWTMHLDELQDFLNDPQQPVVRPANYPAGTPGRGWKYVDTPKGKMLVISLLGKIVGRDADKPVDNPLKVIDAILEENKSIERAATIVNFHGDFSSEKRVIGYYLDGRVSAVIGDHWHVPTADAMVLPKGTAHMTDVGMCGALHSSLGVEIQTIVDRWRDGKVNKNTLETAGPMQFNAVLIKVNEIGLADQVQPLQVILN
jgi:metallophosphoesterase (TIGR00282 family)